MTNFDHAQPCDIAIIGGGGAGTLAAIGVLRGAPAGLRVAIIEPQLPLGRGVAYATGIARRPGAALLSLATLPRVVSAARAGAEDRSDLFVQLALFGGALVATRDTAGRPGLAWRAEQSRKAAEQRVDQSRKSVQQHAEAVGKDVKRAQKKAQAKARKASKKVQAQVKDVLN